MSALVRRRQAIIAAATGFGMLALGLAASLWPGQQAGLATPPDSLTPRLISAVDTVHDIRIVTADDDIVLQRTLEGWALTTRGGYPADTELAERLLNAIASLEPVAQRTRLESRFFELDLDAPENGGAGVHIVMQDANERQVVDLVVGRQRPDGYVYIRRGGESQSWLAHGFVPEVSTTTGWMELDFLSLGREAIRETCVQPASGDPYCLQRLRLSSERFSLVTPRGWEFVSPGAGDGVATVLGRIRFQDVRPAAGLGGRLIGEHRTTTNNGLEVNLTLRRADERDWVTIQAIAQTDAARPQAVALNERTDGWAFEISDLALARLTRPLSGIAQPVPVTEAP